MFWFLNPFFENSREFSKFPSQKTRFIPGSKLGFPPFATLLTGKDIIQIENFPTEGKSVQAEDRAFLA